MFWEKFRSQLEVGNPGWKNQATPYHIATVLLGLWLLFVYKRLGRSDHRTSQCVISLEYPELLYALPGFCVQLVSIAVIQADSSATHGWLQSYDSPLLHLGDTGACFAVACFLSPGSKTEGSASGEVSPHCPLVCGVPEGAILFPVLFNIYMFPSSSYSRGLD